MGSVRVRIFRVGVFLSRNCPGGTYPRCEFSMVKFSGWELSGGNHPGGNFPGASFHVIFSMPIVTPV